MKADKNIFTFQILNFSYAMNSPSTVGNTQILNVRKCKFSNTHGRKYANNITAIKQILVIYLNKKHLQNRPNDETSLPLSQNQSIAT